MRRAQPHEVKDHASPVITARLNQAELAKWLPIQFDRIDDPLQAPEPSLGALAELEDGAYVVLIYGKDSEQLTVEVPETTKNASAVIAAFFGEVPLPLSRVLWRRKGTRLPKQQRTCNESSAAERAKKSAFRVRTNPKRK